MINLSCGVILISIKFLGYLINRNHSRGFVLESICETLLQKKVMEIRRTSQMKLSFSPLKILNRAKIEFWTLGWLKTKKMKINKKSNWEETQRKNISDLEPKALIPNDKIRKSTTRGVRFGLPCWSNISSQEHFVWDSNHSRSKIDHV